MFFRDKSKKSGFASHCKNCVSLYLSSEETKQRRKSYIKIYNEKYLKSEKGIASWKNAQKRYRASGKCQARRRERLKTDVHYKISVLLRVRLSVAILGGQKYGSAIKHLGCSIDEFKKYMESLFLPGMSWANHGVNGWHIDHIRPLSSFDLSSESDISKACHYTNLQPLWASENIRKGNKLPSSSIATE